MKYQNAKDILPAELLEAIQRYAQGELLYIPKAPENHQAWGERTGSKAATRRRNQEIQRAHCAGIPIPRLAAQYYLAEESIRKIVYQK